MRKAAFFGVLLVFIGGMLWSETVLIYIKKGDRQEFSENSLPLAYAFEGGVMDEYFEAGHIIFNASMKNISYWSQYPVNMAKEEGAGVLLEIILQVEEHTHADKTSVTGAKYRLVAVDTLKVLSRGELSAGGVGSQTEEGEQISFLLGKELARESLSSL
jgi:hypothetical protein